MIASVLLAGTVTAVAVTVLIPVPRQAPAPPSHGPAAAVPPGLEEPAATARLDASSPSSWVPPTSVPVLALPGRAAARVDEVPEPAALRPADASPVRLAALAAEAAPVARALAPLLAAGPAGPAPEPLPEPLPGSPSEPETPLAPALAAGAAGAPPVLRAVPAQAAASLAEAPQVALLSVPAPSEPAPAALAPAGAAASRPALAPAALVPVAAPPAPDPARKLPPVATEPRDGPLAAVEAPAPLAAERKSGSLQDRPAATVLAAYPPAEAEAPPAEAPALPASRVAVRSKADEGVTVTARGADPESARRRLVAEVQQALLREGFDPGPADGLEGPRTRTAVRLYERQAGLPEDGVLDLALLRRLGVLAPTPARGDALAKDGAGGLGDALTGVLDGMARALDDLFLGKDAARAGASSAGRGPSGRLQSGSGR